MLSRELGEWIEDKLRVMQAYDHSLRDVCEPDRIRDMEKQRAVREQIERLTAVWYNLLQGLNRLEIMILSSEEDT